MNKETNYGQKINQLIYIFYDLIDEKNSIIEE